MALALKIIEMVLVVVLAFFLFQGGSFGYVVPVLLASLAVSFAASWRLRLVIGRVEGGEGVAGIRSEDSSYMERFGEFTARYAERKAEKLLARAENATARGDDKAAARYRRRAAKERNDAVKCRDAVTKKYGVKSRTSFW